jgi:hypothetical protein
MATRIIGLKDWRTDLHTLTSVSDTVRQHVRCTVCRHMTSFDRELDGGGIERVRALAEFVCTGNEIALRRDVLQAVPV